MLRLFFWECMTIHKKTMINLMPLEGSPYDYFLKTKNRKRGLTLEILNKLDSIVEKRFSVYDKCFKANNLDFIEKEKRYTDEQIKALLHCYQGETILRNQLFASIRQNQPASIKSICQFCGFNSDDTIDHYLPKCDFPEFSLHFKNLLPCCSTCNSLKSNYLIDPNSKIRGIINLYLDQISNRQFLYAKVKFIKGLPLIEFKLINTSHIDKTLFTTICLHYKKLNLIKRYTNRFNSVYVEIESSLSNLRKNNPRIDLKRFLLDDTIELQINRGKNYYKAVIRQALANNEDFIKNLGQE